MTENITITLPAYLFWIWVFFQILNGTLTAVQIHYQKKIRKNQDAIIKNIEESK